MQKILWIGKPYFASHLEDCGFELVRILPVESGLAYSWDRLVASAGFEPDILVVADSQTTPFVLGVENFPCLTIFYSIQAHLHSWHGPYAQAFDICLTTQAGYLERFAAPFLPRERVWHVPPFAPDNLPTKAVKDIDCLILTSANPKRMQFIENLGHKIACLTPLSGNAMELYARSRIVAHYSGEKLGIDFQIFHAMAASACLVTPRVNHGLEKLFVDGEHLVGYAPQDAGDAAYRINFLLENPELIEHISQTGSAEVQSKHLATHRAWTFTDQLCDLVLMGTDDIIRQRLGRADLIRKNCLTIPYLLCARMAQDAAIHKAFIAAANGKFGLTGRS